MTFTTALKMRVIPGWWRPSVGGQAGRGQLLNTGKRWQLKAGAPSCALQEPQREQLSALLDNIYTEFAQTVAAARGKTEADVAAMLDEGIYGVKRSICPAQASAVVA